MKLNHKKTSLNRLVTAIAALGFISIPAVHAESAGSATDTNRGGSGSKQGSGTDQSGSGTSPGGSGTNQDGTGTNQSGPGSNPGSPGTNRSGTATNRPSTDNNRVPLKTEVTQTFVDGYTVPAQYQTYFTEIPAIKDENVVVRYHNGRAFYVNKSDWKIQRIVELDPSVKLEGASTAFVEGYMIPENLRTGFIEVPKIEDKQSVRFYNNTAYVMDSDFRIVRTVRLSR